MTGHGGHGGYNPGQVFTVIAIMLIVEALLFGPFLIEWDARCTVSLLVVATGGPMNEQL